MRKRSVYFLLPLLLILLPAVAHAVEFADEVSEADTRMVKVGEGTFKWTFFRIYDGALYIDARQPDADPLSDVARRLVLEYNRSFTAEQFRKSGNEILERNSDPETLRNLRDRLETLNAAYQPVEKGDRYALTYVPGTGTSLRLNGERLVTVPGADFARAYFAIWLGEDPAKQSFRDDLLGDR
jgi:hypothetical protein